MRGAGSAYIICQGHVSVRLVVPLVSEGFLMPKGPEEPPHPVCAPAPGVVHHLVLLQGYLGSKVVDTIRWSDLDNPKRRGGGPGGAHFTVAIPVRVGSSLGSCRHIRPRSFKAARGRVGTAVVLLVRFCTFTARVNTEPLLATEVSDLLANLSIALKGTEVS